MIFTSPLKIIFTLMLFCIVVLPTGSIYHVNIKLILLIVSIPLISLQFFFKPKKEIIFSLLVSAMFVFFLILWLIIGVVKQGSGNFYGFLQAKDFLATFVVTWMGYYLYRTKQITYKQIFNYIVIFHIFYIITKIVLFLLLICGFIKIEDALSIMDSIFSYKFVTSSYGNIFFRIDLINDVASPFIFLFILFGKYFRINYGKIRYFIYLLLFINILIGFKRTLIVLFVYFAIMAFILEKRHLKKIMYASLFLLGLIISLNCTKVNELIGQRFHSNAQQVSDSIRSEQILALSNEFFKNFVIGKGLGGYAKNYIRSASIPYSYEVQWLSFLMQFGLLGMILLLIIFSLPIIPLFFIRKNILTRESFIIFIGFFSWILIAFTNPLLVASFCSSLYMIMLIFSCELKNEKNKNFWPSYPVQSSKVYNEEYSFIPK
ncbi:MAG: hypothetical protein PHQ11_10310 [Paludibacter sp.]|nr:hypothetical protein [Paludibacter sp.]